MSENLHYSTIFFDLYGTLVDIKTDEDSDAAWSALRIALYREGADFATNEQLRKTFTREMAKANAVRDQSEWFEPDVLPAYRALFDVCWVDGSLDQAKNMAWTFRRASTQKLRLYDGAKEFLQQLKDEGRKIVLVSNAQKTYTRPELKLLGLDDVFDEILISSDEGVRKPSIELFRRALIRSHSEPEHVLMVGNDERSDIAGAASMGIDAAYLHTDDNTGAAVAPQAVKSFEGPDYRGLLQFIHEADTTTD